MRPVYILALSLLGIAMLFVLLSRWYRSSKIDKGLETHILNDAIIIDVRTEREYGNGHIEGAINISLGTIRERYTELDSSQTYITYCSHGLRSVEAKKILSERGFRKVYNGGAISDLEDALRKTHLNKR